MQARFASGTSWVLAAVLVASAHGSGMRMRRRRQLAAGCGPQSDLASRGRSMSSRRSTSRSIRPAPKCSWARASPISRPPKPGTGRRPRQERRAGALCGSSAFASATPGERCSSPRTRIRAWRAMSCRWLRFGPITIRAAGSRYRKQLMTFPGSNGDGAPRRPIAGDDPQSQGWWPSLDLETTTAADEGLAAARSEPGAARASQAG